MKVKANIDKNIQTLNLNIEIGKKVEIINQINQI